jgi:hypothetical protein
MLLWGVGPAFMLAGAILALACLNPAATVTTLARVDRQWLIVSAVVGWALPVLVSLWKPIFEATRTPMMLLPVSAALIAVVLRDLGGRVAALTLALVVLFAAGQRLAAASGPDPFPTRASIDSLLRRTACGDTIVATGLAHGPVEYYLRRLDAPACLHYVRFPQNLMDWPGRIQRPEVRRELEQEAQALAERTSAIGTRAWMLTLARGLTAEASTMAEAALRRRMVCEDRVPLRGASFDALVMCKPASPTQ